MSDVVRRKWDTSATQAAAKPTASSSSTSLPPPTKLLTARTGKLAFENLVGKHALVQAGTSPASGQAQAGFYCSLCDHLLKDSVSYLDHLNSPYHLKLAGHKLEIKRATVHDVRARLAMHKRRRLELAAASAAGGYDLDKRVELIKAQREAEKVARKEQKRQRKEEERRAREEGGGAVGRRKRMKKSRRPGGGEEVQDDEDDPFGSMSESGGEEDQSGSSGSEYSDYEIDEHGNIIEPEPGAAKQVKKKRRVASEVEEPAVEMDKVGRGGEQDVSAEDIAAMMGFGTFGGSSKT